MYKKETKEVVKLERVTVSCICDHCGKEERGNTRPDHWHEFVSFHNDWGNDSIESHEDHLVCSPECYFEVLKDFLRQNSDSYTAQADEMGIGFVKEMVKYIDK